MDRVEQAINDIKNGKMVVMVDDEDRENEGDLVFAATFSDTQKVNFAITHAKGVLCLALNEEIARRLDLNLMVDKNTSCHETAFTVTIDAKNTTTGVSAYERDVTIRLAADPMSKPEDFVRPGHIFPLIAKKGGVLSRTGHTEGSVDLCKLAGLTQAAVICEIVKEDGNMARRPDLEEFCEKFGLNMVSVSELVQYRLKHESLIEIKDKTAVKFHQISSDVELLCSDKFDDLRDSLEYLSKNGGVAVFLQGEEKCGGQVKDYGIGAQILHKLGVSRIELLSANKNKDFVALKGFGLDIAGYKE